MSEKKGFFRASAEDFKKIPGSAGVYWRNSDLSDAPLTFRVFQSGGALA